MLRWRIQSCCDLPPFQRDEGEEPFAWRSIVLRVLSPERGAPFDSLDPFSWVWNPQARMDEDRRLSTLIVNNTRSGPAVGSTFAQNIDKSVQATCSGE